MSEYPLEILKSIIAVCEEDLALYHFNILLSCVSTVLPFSCWRTQILKDITKLKVRLFL